MTAWTVDRLLACTGRYGHRLSLAEQPITDYNDPVRDRYIQEYTHADVGWRIVKELARQPRIISVPLLGDDQWILRAVFHQAGRMRDPVITRAVTLGTAPEMTRHRELLMALLVVEGATITNVAHVLNMDRDVVACFERLFFNIIDRRNDYAFLREVVYPNNRLAEMFDNYIRHEDLGTILMRAGFNNGTADVLFLAGATRVDLIKSMATGDNLPHKLEALWMANAYVAARNGFLNQSDARGLSDARALLQAAKQGGQDQGDVNPLPETGAMIYDELTKFTRSAREIQARHKIDAMVDTPLLPG